MNHYVPDFDMPYDDYSIPTSSSSIAKQNGEEDIMELLWQNGQVVAHSQMQRSNHKSPPMSKQSGQPRQQPPPPPPPPENNQLCIAEDEMATWFHYPFEDIYNDILYPTSTPPAQQTQSQSQSLPPHPPPQASVATRAVQYLPPPPSRPPVPPPRNFSLFSRFRERALAPSTGVTVVESNKQGADASSGTGTAVSAGDVSAAMSRAPPMGDGGGSGELMVSSSTGGSASGSGTSPTGTVVAASVEGGDRKKDVVEDRKRKGRVTDEATATTTTTTTTAECHTEDVEHESAEEKKHSRGSAAKRSRAAEVHNLSERRRRDRINEKMRALQELIPRCNKSDKASMLDEAIEYLKSLQMQVQMMSMGCGIVPMMYPGMQQQYMPHMGMGMGMAMGMGMGMDMGMNRPMMPFPTAVPAAVPTTPGASVVFTTPAAAPPTAPPLAPRFPVPAFSMHSARQPGVSGSNQAESISNPATMQTPALPQVAVNLADPFQQYMALQQMQMRSQSVAQPSSSKPTSSKPSSSMSEEVFDDSQCGKS